MSRIQALLRAHVGALELDVELASAGAPLALVGPNGSGKTSVLRALAGALRAQHAEVTIDGQIFCSTQRGIEPAIEQRRVGYVPQGYRLFTHLDVLDNVAFGLSTGPRKQPRAARRAHARTLLAELGCEDLARRRVPGLSGGEQQRVALARALIIEPRLLLLDEPLAALDVGTRRAVRAFLARRVADFSGPVILVTHDVRDVVALSATLCVIERGTVVQAGTLEALRAQPATDFVAEFLALRD